MEQLVILLRIMQVIMLVIGIPVGILGIVFLVLKLKKIKFQTNRKIIFISIVMIIYGIGSVLMSLGFINYYIDNIVPTM
ncbi:hypothetical protein [Ruminococcus sp. zg-924]|uniref:hypothetical protein n=1 Tax=Ruminococcus sp. zg-924 TaxID=2678505 RepID=UPI00210C7457|nr:hypothetical protein [Ruminococcus sp. zg-924]MCQ4021803.1 hypothetical protein [Ruminococcus sp. zg-924]